LIYKEGDRYTAKLTDFSLARICNEKVNGIAYTIGYRPPEVETLKIYTYKSDIWALGETFKVLRDSFPELKTELFDNLIKGMCTVSLDKRYDIYDVLRHPWFKEFVNSLEYPTESAECKPPIAIQTITDKILEHQNSPHSLIDFFREKVF
jgi:serine/threonine protein kinase